MCMHTSSQHIWTAMNQGDRRRLIVMSGRSERSICQMHGPDAFASVLAGYFVKITHRYEGL
jgi:hypothetical protein